MRVLSSTEALAATGAAAFGDVGASIGSVIGNVFDLGISLLGLHSNATAAASQLGEGLGLIADSILNPGNIPAAILDVGEGVVGIIGVGFDLAGQIAASAANA